MRWICAGVLAVVASAAQAETQQFDLVCKGTGAGGYYKDKTVAWERRYRIDLATNRWCMDECSEAQPIASVTTDQLTFKRDGIGDPRVKPYYHWVSRISGDMIRYMGGLGVWLDEKGHCTPAPFSGLPTPKF
jgi:hypothetical protein